ncbi:DUF2231 domain-containing protein [Psychroflexus aestuariivivens]|uniref:DUF2231 domain-containing protein n=1 Tax=Psychroflexus aestuariivivens TaxID=1795040 RepID=UPI000FD88765|nr:DUF2231 domain-containing protein [Psychroflexus aestuariivivens]
MQTPEFWRDEIWHPLSVHFPIALIFLATIFKLLSFRFKKFSSTASILIIGSGVFCWISYYTGSLADGAVSRTLCDPTVLKTHENYAYYLSILLSVIGILEIFKITFAVPFKRILNFILTLGLLICCIGVGYVGHLGAELVYQQAAGVYTPSQDCKEFE